MLILTRTCEESFVLYDEEKKQVYAKIKILDILPHQVTIGIDAPRSIKIDRAENMGNKLNAPDVQQKVCSYQSFNVI